MFNSRLFRFFLLYFLPFAFLLTAGFAIFLRFEHVYHVELIKNNEQLQLKLVQKALVRDFELILPDLNILANENYLKQYLETFDESARQLLEREFASIIRHRRIYKMIRLLDNEGRERVRVDLKQDKAIITPTDKLQDKVKRYYFQDAKDLGPGELYISPIDLNIEHGEVEKPHVPMIRFVMPLYDSVGNKQGVLVLNYLAEHMLKHFDELLGGSAGHVSLLNQDGYWIRSHKKEREWGFMYGNNWSFDKVHPELWPRINERDEGQLLTADGIYTHVTLFPLETIGGYSPQEVEDEHVGHHHIDPRSYYWKIVSDVPREKLNRELMEHVQGATGSIWLLLLLLGGVSCWHFAGNRVERLHLRSQMELHAKLFQTSIEGVFFTDAKGNIIEVNEAFTEITGYARDEVLGKNPRMLSSGRHDEAFYSDMWSELLAKEYWQGEIFNRRKDGSIIVEWLRIFLVKDEDGKVVNYIAIFSDITSRKLTEEELQKRAHHDPLTGLANRLSFDERLQQSIARTRRSKRKLALLYIDLDKFKPINDSYGHQVGDAVLCEVAKRLQAEMREIDTVARLGGDEFVVILTEIEHAKDASLVTERILQSLKRPIVYEDLQLYISASIGIAICPDDAVKGKELVMKADTAMYRIKQLSRNKYGFYSEPS